MPQLNIETWPPQLIWLAISFLALFFIMRFVALPRVGGVIERRQKQVNDDLAAAQRFKAATEKAIADYEAALAEARAKGNAIAQATREKLARETEQERAKVEGEINERVSAAEKAIAQSKAKAMADIEKVAADLAAEIVTELAGITASTKGAARGLSARAPSKTDAE
ncbi:MAG TPA: F0F1 ATP synthase subunit B' [Aestuariivirgaceae bacterium]|jgi:F-type H+-transporting ATPase subunit b